jgi:hypothetical protein
MNKLLRSAVALIALTYSARAERLVYDDEVPLGIMSVSPGSLCDTVEPVFTRRDSYVPASDQINGRNIFQIENGSKVSVCGAPVRGWRHISFIWVSNNGKDSREYTGWVRREFIH